MAITTNSLVAILKELYEDGPSVEELAWHMYVNACEKEAGLELTPEPVGRNFIKDMLYTQNPFLKLVPKNEFEGAIMPMLIPVDKK